jgi:nitrate reductase NapD
MSGYNICGVVVRSHHERAGDIRQALLQMPGVEIHASDGGRTVLTVEDEDSRRLGDTLTQIQLVDGVLSASLVYQYSDQQDIQEDTEQ